VSIDADGFVVHTKSVNNYADGGSVVSENTFSQFGCAGVVGLPGRVASWHARRAGLLYLLAGDADGSYRFKWV
jgi:hypothetical protein